MTTFNTSYFAHKFQVIKDNLMCFRYLRKVGNNFTKLLRRIKTKENKKCQKVRTDFVKAVGFMPFRNFINVYNTIYKCFEGSIP